MSSSASLISRVWVEKLFGYLNHSISFENDDPRDSNINLLYGENGSGKTTLLRLIYCSLSKNVNEGLRGYISVVPFKTFVVEMSHGVRIELSREAAATGPYKFSIFSSKREVSADITPGENFKVNHSTSPGMRELSAALQE
ncbi:AAA family ATPase, partial [Bradyrhizobium sp. BR 10261]|nr:AAA family ATPase [Bradyrhizobium sp. BR 10261]